MPEAIISAKGTEAPTVRPGRLTHGLDEWWPWMAEPVREGVEDGIQWQIMTNDVLFSWQGYAHIPDGHVRRHLNADDIEPLVDVYGGVTYGPDRQGRIGFDTLQGNSSLTSSRC